MEQILLLALFLLVAFASSLTRWLKARMEGHPRADTKPPDNVTVRRSQRPPGQPVMPVGTPSVTHVRPLPAPPIETRRPSRPRLGDRSDLRRAIVLTAILGPCRALEGEQPSPRR